MTSVLEEGLREQIRKKREAEIERVARLSMWQKKRPTLLARLWAALTGKR